ncbi:alpha-E domain-containing protein [Kineococcus glutinatus]|uniref:Alpha-E domain-containing protein n=1 Tax=Kineococcus glutinatus TaxID=1070872 RepID=A0ABP9IBS3_9ACTN
MLSRIAESLFWIGRYVERADDTARILDVHVERSLDDPWLDEATVCRALMGVMGVPDDGVDPTRARLLARLAHDAVDPSSVAGAIGAARENARRARETVSSEVWEGLNTTWLSIASGRWTTVSAHRYCNWVRERTAVVSGLVDSTMSRDESWHFLVLGRSLERADMTARLLTTGTLHGAGPTWPTLLRSCGAYEAFLRTYSGSALGAAGEEQAAEFLLLDRLFPRSVLNALTTAEASLEALEPQDPRGVRSEDAHRILGRARTELQYAGDLLQRLPEHMARVQAACSAAAEAVGRRFFPLVGATSWVEADA